MLCDALEGVPTGVDNSTAGRILTFSKRLARQINVESPLCGSDITASLRYHFMRCDPQLTGKLPYSDFDAVMSKVLGAKIATASDVRQVARLSGHGVFVCLFVPVPRRVV